MSRVPVSSGGRAPRSVGQSFLLRLAENLDPTGEDTPVAPPPGWCQDVFSLLRDSGHLRVALAETFQLPPEEVAQLMTLAEHDFSALVAAFA